MITSAFDPGLPGSLPENLPEAWPDTETLSRLANELFAARPGGPSIPLDLTADVPLGQSAPSPVTLPGEAELKALLDLAPRFPSITTAAPAFYFLEHIVTPPPAVEPRSSLQGFSAPFDVAAVRRDFPVCSHDTLVDRDIRRRAYAFVFYIPGRRLAAS